MARLLPLPARQLPPCLLECARVDRKPVSTCRCRAHNCKESKSTEHTAGLSSCRTARLLPRAWRGTAHTWVGRHQRGEAGVECRQPGDAADQGVGAVQPRQRDASHAAAAVAGTEIMRKCVWPLDKSRRGLERAAARPVQRARTCTPDCHPLAAGSGGAHLCLNTHSPPCARLNSSSGTNSALMTLSSSVRVWKASWPAGSGRRSAKGGGGGT